MRTTRSIHSGNPFAYDDAIWHALGGHPQGTGLRLAADEWRQRVQNEVACEAMLRLADEANPRPTPVPLRSRLAAALGSLSALLRAIRLAAGTTLAAKR